MFQDGDKSPLKLTEDGTQPSSRGTRSAGVKSEEELDVEVSKVTQDIDRPTSTVKFSAHLEVADIPSRSMSSLGPSRMSLMDEHGKPSRTSIATVATATEGMVFGRDAVIEREKINEEAKNTFAVMDLRYRDMIQDLIDLDNAFELGLMSGSRQEFEDKIQGMKIVQTPPNSASKKAMVELHMKAGESVVENKELEQLDDTSGEKDFKEEVKIVDGAPTYEQASVISMKETEIEKDTVELLEKMDKQEAKHLEVRFIDTEITSVETAKPLKEKSDIEIVVTDSSPKKSSDL